MAIKAKDEEIIFRLSRPFKVSRTDAVDRVQLPAVDGNITILPDRAPTLILLSNGLLQILDKNGQSKERYFIKGGIADVARNRCAVSTEKVVMFDKIDIIKAAEKRDAAILDDDKQFYQMIIDKLNIINNTKK